MQNWFARKDDPESEGTHTQAITPEILETPAASVQAKGNGENTKGPLAHLIAQRHQAAEPCEQAAEQSLDETTPRELTLLTEAHRAIAEVHGLDEIKAIRDKAEAVRKYAQSAGMGLELQNYAAEVKLRAERKAGELLLQLQLHGGDRKSQQAEQRIKLEDLGVTKDQSSRWQLTASIPERDFEKYVTSTKSELGEVTTAGLLRVAKDFVARRRKRFKQRKDARQPAATCDALDSLPLLIEQGRRFACVYVNPNWPEAESNDDGRVLDELLRLPISQICTENSHVHLWVPDFRMPDAPRVIAAWGFKFASCFVWVSGKGGNGDYWRTSHQLLALGVRGVLPFRGKSVLSWVRADLKDHTVKPEVVRKLIERVSPGPYLELFGSQPTPGWTVLGSPAASSHQAGT